MNHFRREIHSRDVCRFSFQIIGEQDPGSAGDIQNDRILLNPSCIQNLMDLFLIDHQAGIPVRRGVIKELTNLFSCYVLVLPFIVSALLGYHNLS